MVQVLGQKPSRRREHVASRDWEQALDLQDRRKLSVPVQQIHNNSVINAFCKHVPLQVMTIGLLDFCANCITPLQKVLSSSNRMSTSSRRIRDCFGATAQLLNSRSTIERGPDSIVSAERDFSTGVWKEVSRDDCVFMANLENELIMLFDDVDFWDCHLKISHASNDQMPHSS